MAMKIEVDFDKCESNAVCMQVAPAYFEVRDDDFLYVLTEDVEGDDLAVVQEAVDRCPKQAISLTEQ
jgi:ferredoxin